MSNRVVSDNTILRRGVDVLAGLLPRSWRLGTEQPAARTGPDALFTVTAEDGTSTTVAVEVKSSLAPRDVASLAEQLRPYDPSLVIAPFLSPTARERLEAAGLNHLDLTGNARIRFERPAMFVRTDGADRDPWRTPRGAGSLKGGKAARIVRALADLRPPFGIRQLADQVDADPGYVSRVIDLLDREDVIGRAPRGPVTEVDWPALLRRWTQDYSLLVTNRPLSAIEPRGLEAFQSKLRATRGLRYALTGSLAIWPASSVAPARLGVCYVDDPEELAERLELTPTDVGANVILVEPFDPVVYERTRMKDGLTLAALSQVTADLMTSPGRGPSEAEELVSWMRANEDDWRT